MLSHAKVTSHSLNSRDDSYLSPSYTCKSQLKIIIQLWKSLFKISYYCFLYKKREWRRYNKIERIRMTKSFEYCHYFKLMRTSFQHSCCYPVFSNHTYFLFFLLVYIDWNVFYSKGERKSNLQFYFNWIEFFFLLRATYLLI